MKSLLLCFLVGALTLSCSTKEQFFYVSPTGSDENDGGIESPFGSLAKAVSRIEELKEENSPAAITVFLREGTYYQKQTITLNSIHSGSTDAPLIIKAYPDEKVILSGGKALRLNWEKIEGGLMRANVGKLESFDQLFINGKKQIRARYPNVDLSEAIYNGYAADAIAKERVKTWQNPVNGVLHAMHRAEWGGYHYTIQEKKADGNLELEGGYQNNRQMGMHERFRYVENIREELDSPGEWFLDQAGQMLYYYPYEGQQLKGALVEVPGLHHILEIQGSEKEPVQHITIEGFTFTHTSMTFMETREPLLRSDWAIYRGGAILLSGAERCIISNNHFVDLGGNAVFVNNYNRGIEIKGNHFEQIGANAISFVGSPEAVRSPSYEYHEYVSFDQLDRQPGPKSNDYPAESTVHDNLIRDIGRVEKQVAGVQISMAMDITVSHNSIYNLPRSGINISEGTWGGHLIEFNDVFNTVLETGDHGSFNSWGRDRFWHPNRDSLNARTSKEPSLITLDAIKTTVIRNNRFRCDHGWDIDLDDGSSNYHIYNNLSLNGGIKLREGFNRRVENNIMVNNSFHPHVWFDESHDVFKNNIVMTGYKPIRVPEWGDEVDFNLFPDSTTLLNFQAKGIDQHSTYGNPEFVNPTQGDFTVKETSPAFKIGFKNFPMDQFGVLSVNLKSLALTPEIPMLFTADTDESKRQTYDFLGAKVRRIQGLGERSAAGLTEEKGMMILSISSESLAKTAGLKERDVILKLNGEDASDIRKLMEAYRGNLWKGQITLTIIRNQKEQEIPVTLK